MQKFIARERFEFSNGAIGWRPGGMFDCLGPYAKVENCPIDGTALDGKEVRRTAYATGYADTYFSIPACTRYRGRYISGYLTYKDGACVFVPHTRHHEVLPMSFAVILERVREYLVPTATVGRFEACGKWYALRLLEKVWR